MKFVIIPYVEVNGSYSLTDGVLREIWQKIVEQGLMQVVFYRGQITSEDDFIKLAKASHNVIHFIFTKDEGQIALVAWLNDIHETFATAHFLIFQEMWGKQSRNLGKLSLQYWFDFKKNDGSPLLDVIIGKTPHTYEIVINYLKKLGMTVLGVVPYVDYDIYKDEKIGHAISFITREDFQNGQERRE